MCFWMKCEYSSSTQVVVLRSDRGRLHLFGFSVELQPFPPEGAGPQLQLPAGFWSEGDLCSSGQSTL